MKTSCQVASLLVGVTVALSACGRVGYDGGGLDGGGEPLADAEGKRDVTERPDAHDSGTKTADARTDTGKPRDAAVETGAGDAVADTGAGDAATDTRPGDAVSEATVGDAGDAGDAHDARASDAEAGVDAGPCIGPYVCGDGTDNTTLNTSYTCSGGKLGTTGVACAFGCDITTGQCADLVPANTAASHLPSGNAFTCLGSQTSSLPSISGGAGETITFDTTNATVTVGATTIAAVWGAPYTSAFGGTSLIVAHVAGLSLTSGASVMITGTSALILLVDGNVSVSGSTTVIDLSAHFSTAPTPSPLPGPGSSTAGTGGSSTPEAQNGGGGGGHGVAGGSGGVGSAAAGTVAAGGLAYGSPFVLEAGSSGGGTSPDHVGRGGGGLQISACGDISIGSGVLVNASGGGGAGGAAGTLPGGGFGGGSGGTIILESATANSLAGFLVANGGGGGQGASGSNVAGMNGYDRSSVYNAPASGGGPVGVAGSGGAGGAGTTMPADGIAGAAGAGGGGGGGAYGAIFIAESPIAVTPLNATSASPTPLYSHVCTTAGNCAY